jgi:hypothetical protein
VYLRAALILNLSDDPMFKLLVMCGLKAVIKDAGVICLLTHFSARRHHGFCKLVEVDSFATAQQTAVILE